MNLQSKCEIQVNTKYFYVKSEAKEFKRLTEKYLLGVYERVCDPGLVKSIVTATVKQENSVENLISV